MIWEGIVVGNNRIRKAREKNVDVTAGLTDSCVKKQGKKPSTMQTGSAKEDWVGMNQQVEKQAGSLWRFLEQGQTECGNAECKETQRKIGSDMKMRKIAEELKAGISKVISMPHGKKGGERIRCSNV